MDNGASSYRRFLGGDKEAFRELIELYRENLIFFINRFVCNLSIAEDVAEDCFVELIVHPHRYNFKVSLKTYLFTIARNKSVDYIRHEAKIVTCDLDEVQDKSADYIALEEQIINDERKVAINSAILELKDDYRMVIHLIYFEELSYMDAGLVMKKDKKQIENLVYRAKNALQVILEKEDLCYEEH